MKPAIVILSAAGGYGGAEKSLEALLPPLASEYQVHLLAQNPRHVADCRRIAAVNPALHVSVLPGWSKPFQLIYGVGWLLARWSRYRPRFVLANNNKSAMLVALAARLTPRLARHAILYVRDFEWRQRAFIFGALKRALILVPTKALLDPPDYLAPWVEPRGAARCEVVMNAVVLTSRTGVPEQGRAPYIVMPATVQEWKGHLYVVKALAHTPSTLRVVFLGDIQDRDYYRKVLSLAQDEGVADRIEFRSFDPDICALIAGSVCVVIASVAQAGGPETFGRTIIEGWAARKPVVAFAVGGPGYIIENGKDGILVPEGDSEALADAMTALLQDPDLAARLGQAGFVKARERFSPARIHADFCEAVGRV